MGQSPRPHNPARLAKLADTNGSSATGTEIYRRRFDTKFRLVYVDSAYQRTRERFGIGQQNDSIFAGLADTEGARIRRLLARLTPDRDMVSYELTILDEAGNMYWQQWTDRAVYNNTGDLIEYRSIGSDITKQRLDERRTESRAQRRLNAMANIAQQAVANGSGNGLLNNVCDALAVGLDAEITFVMRLDLDQARWVVSAVHGLPLGLVDTAMLGDDVRTLPGYTRLHSSDVLIADLKSEDRFSRPQWLTEKDAASGVSLVIPGHDSTAGGIVAAFRRDGRSFEESDISFLRSAVSLVGLVVKRGKDLGSVTSEPQNALNELKRNQAIWARKYELNKLVREVAIAANQAETREDVFRIALSKVCAHTGWPLGHVFQLDEQTGRLHTSRVWYMQRGRRFTVFKRATESVGYAHESGLPGRAADLKQPVWIPAIANDPGFWRADKAREDGIVSGLALPVVLENTVVAVLEFFTDRASEPDTLLLEALRDIGAQISPVVERTRAEERVRSQIRQQKMIAMLGQDALSGLQYGELFLRAALTLRGALDVELCDVLELNPDSNTLLLKEGVGWQEGNVGTVSMPASNAMLPGYALKSELPVLSDSRQGNSDFSIPDLYLRHGVVNSLCIPIIGSKGVYGVLGVHSRKARHYSQEQIAFVQSVASVLAQIAERHRSEEALRESRERFATLAANIPGFVFRLVMDVEGKGSFAYVSPGAREIFDKDPSAVMSDVSPLIESIHPDDRAAYYRSVAESAQTLQQWSWGGRVQVGDHTKWLQGMARPFRGVDGSTTWDGVILDETARKSAELRTQALLQDNRNLTKKLLYVQEEEYKRLARELHDELGQSLTAIKSDAILIKRHSEVESKAHISAVAIEEAAEQIYDVTHAMMRRLRPSTLDELGLSDTLQQMVRDWRQRSNIECSLQVDEEVDGLDDEYTITIYRVIQESLTNVERHAEATYVEIFINLYVASIGPGYLVMYIKDNGKGTELSDATSVKGHYGLLGIRERIEAIGGYLEVNSELGAGFQLRAHIPLLPRLLDNADLLVQPE